MNKLLLILSMLLLPKFVCADESGTCGENVTYTFIESTGTLTISGNGAMNDYYFNDTNIPWDNYKTSIKELIIESGLTSIGNNAFLGCSNITSIIIPNSVTYIGQNAFCYCSGLIDVTLPSSLKIIEDGTFCGCNSLIKITLPEELTTIGSYAFSECTSINNIRLPNSVSSIGRGAFEECKNLTSFTVPNGVKVLYFGTFKDCENLSSITLPSSIEKISEYAFSFCNKLDNVYIEDMAAWCNIDFEETQFAGYKYVSNPLEHANHLFLNGEEIHDLVLPDNIESIGKYAFWRFKGLTSVEIPNSIASIGKRAFAECRNIKSAFISNNLTTIEEELFSGCEALENVILPEKLQIIKSSAFEGCKALSSIILPQQLQYIYSNAFSDCYGLNEVRCLANTPPMIFENSFSNYNIPLYVPNGCVDLYKNADYWKNFLKITDGTKYKLTYIIDNEEYKTYEYEAGAAITPESEPTKEGYTFSGWNDLPQTMPANDVTVTGTFTINKYKLVYMVDGTEYKTYDVEYNADITPEAEPTKEGYTFSGWNDLPQTMPANDVIVTGTFTINKYKLVYMVDGSEYQSYDIEYGASITPEAAPTRDGYTFSGWSNIPTTMPANDVTVTGSFVVNKYTLTYMVDGEVYKAYEIEYGATITPEAYPIKEGYSFSGWSDIPSTMPARDVTITGSFSRGAYTLTYIVDGEVYKIVSYDYGSTITPETEPTKEGYTFSGWSYIPSTMPAEDVTVYGTFTVNEYTLTYMVDGEVYKSYDIEYGTYITPEAEPTKEGYTFSGWSDIPETMPANDVTVTGTFTINKYKITYIIDGEVYLTEEVEYGSRITPPYPDDREGYDFAWGDYPSTMPAEDITIYGSYTTTGIKAIWASEPDVKIFTVSGKPLNKVQKGVNILRYKDGRTRKIVVK